MLGAAAIVLVLVVVIPVSVFVGGAIATAVLGTLLKNEGEASHEGSELIDLNV